MVATVVAGGLGGRHREWDALVDAEPRPSPFLSSWWLTAPGVAPAGTVPRFVLVLDEGRLLGGLALQRGVRHGLPWYDWLGSGPLQPDHLDVVADAARRDDVLAAARTWLARCRAVVDLRGCDDDARVLAVLPGRPKVVPLEAAPFVDLRGDTGAYLAGLPGPVRTTLRKAGRRLARQGVAVRLPGLDQAVASGLGVPLAVVDGPSDEELLAQLRLLHGDLWGQESSFLPAWDAFAAAAAAGCRAGRVRVGALVAPDGEVGAVQADLLVPRRACSYQTGRSAERRWAGAGSLLRLLMLATAAARGCEEYDLLRGGEAYKREWATRVRTLVAARAGGGPAPRALLAGHRAWVALAARRGRAR